MERGRLPVAERDRAGLVEQQHVDVAGRLDGAARGRDHVGAHHAVHAGDADRRQQPADRRRDQADEQRDEHGERHDGALARGRDRVRENGASVAVASRNTIVMHREQDRQRDLVRRAAALRAFDHRDHAVEEALALAAGDAHDEPVGQHARAAGHGREVAAGLAQHGRRLAGDGALVDRRDAFDDLAVGRNDVVRLHEHEVVAAQRAGFDGLMMVRS